MEVLPASIRTHRDFKAFSMQACTVKTFFHDQITLFFYYLLLAFIISLHEFDINLISIYFVPNWT